MNPTLAKFIVAAVAYGICLTVAALVLDGFNLGWVGWILAWALFTLSVMIIKAIAKRMLPSEKLSATAITLLASLIAVFGSLWVCVILLPTWAIDIRGFGTWVASTLIITLGALVYSLVDDRLVKAATPMVERAAAKVSGK